MSSMTIAPSFAAADDPQFAEGTHDACTEYGNGVSLTTIGIRAQWYTDYADPQYAAGYTDAWLMLTRELAEMRAVDIGFAFQVHGERPGTAW